jgi:signal transduction histidine kinase
MSVSRRVVLSVGVPMLLALVVLAYQLSVVIRMQRTNDDLSNVNFTAASLLLQMERDVEEIDDFTQKYFAFADISIRTKYGQSLDERIERFDKQLKKLELDSGSREARDEIALLSTAWIDYQTQIESARNMATEGGRDVLPLGLRPAIDVLATRTRSSKEAVLESIRVQVRHNQALGREAESISLAAAALFLVVGGTIVYLTLRAINKPLHQLTRGTRTIANGEFSHRLPEDGPSEFAELARDFNSMTEKLGELDQMKRDFVAHVSHELKAPLAAIRQTLAVTLEQVPGQINDSQRKLLQLSRNSAERLTAMVANLLDVSRLEAGTMEYEMSAQDIVGIVIQVVDEFSLKAEERKIQITVTSNMPGIPVVCDGDRMIQVIGNLVDNALKFSPTNSTIELDVRHNPSASASTSTATVSIADRGIGVPEDHKLSVFEKFHQVRGGGKRTAGQGVGLGLAICKTIMDAHRGRIWVEDNPGGGSVFRVEMRAAQMKEEVKCG